MEFNLINILLGLSFFISAIVAALLFIKSQEASGRFLALTVFGVMTWVFPHILVINSYFDLAAIKIMYIAGIFILGNFFFFALSYQGAGLKKYEILAGINLFFGFLLLVILIFTNAMISGVKFIDGTRLYRIITGPWYYAYIIYAVAATAAGVQLLVSRIKTIKDGAARTNLYFIGVGTSIAMIFGVFFNVIMPLLGIYNYVYWGPITVTVFVVFVSYFILQRHIFEISVVAAEVLVVPIILVAFLQLFFRSDTSHLLERVLLFFAVFVLSLLLLKSMDKEIAHRRQIEKLNARLSNFVSFAAHELRTPISKFKGGLDLVRRGEYGPLPEKAKEILGRMHETASDMSLDVDTFLSLNKLEIGRLELNREAVDLEKLAGDCINDFTAAAREKVVGMTLLKGQTVAMVRADKFKIRHVINNLLSNAVKYTPSGGEIEISLHPGDNGKAVVFSVNDTGIGIPKEYIGELFSLYERGTRAAKLTAGGSGVGLYLARKIIELHGGKIRAESDGLGMGSKFSFSLPVGRES